MALNFVVTYLTYFEGSILRLWKLTKHFLHPRCSFALSKEENGIFGCLFSMWGWVNCPRRTIVWLWQKTFARSLNAQLICIEYKVVVEAALRFSRFATKDHYLALVELEHAGIESICDSFMASHGVPFRVTGLAVQILNRVRLYAHGSLSTENE